MRAPNFFSTVGSRSPKVQHCLTLVNSALFFSSHFWLLFFIHSMIITFKTTTMSCDTQFHSLKRLWPPVIMSYTPPSQISSLPSYLLSVTCCPSNHSITSLFFQPVIKVDLIKRQEKKLIYICIHSIAIH